MSNLSASHWLFSGDWTPLGLYWNSWWGTSQTCLSYIYLQSHEKDFYVPSSSPAHYHFPNSTCINIYGFVLFVYLFFVNNYGHRSSSLTSDWLLLVTNAKTYMSCETSVTFLALQVALTVHLSFTYRIIFEFDSKKKHMFPNFTPNAASARKVS